MAATERYWIAVRVGLALAALLNAGAGLAEATSEARDVLFHDIASAVETARQNQVDVLAPRGYAKAVEELGRAREDYERGRNPKRIQDRIADATASLAEASKSADVARVTLEATLRTRADAVTVDAAKHAPEAWGRPARFTDATTDVERGDVRAAQRHGAEAEVLFRDGARGHQGQSAQRSAPPDCAGRGREGGALGPADPGGRA